MRADETGTTGHQDAHGCLILVVGLPGSGKTTYASSLASLRRAIRCCPDDWIEAILSRPDDVTERDRLRDPIENLQWSLAREWLDRGMTVILENGFWAEEERTQYAMEALEQGARIEMHSIETPNLEQLWNQVEARNRKLNEPTWIMSRADLDRAWGVFQPPTEYEMAFYDDFVAVMPDWVR